jgi:hypothetical protein
VKDICRSASNLQPAEISQAPHHLVDFKPENHFTLKRKLVENSVIETRVHAELILVDSSPGKVSGVLGETDILDVANQHATSASTGQIYRAMQEVSRTGIV